MARYLIYYNSQASLVNPASRLRAPAGRYDVSCITARMSPEHVHQRKQEVKVAIALSVAAPWSPPHFEVKVFLHDRQSNNMNLRSHEPQLLENWLADVLRGCAGHHAQTHTRRSHLPNGVEAAEVLPLNHCVDLIDNPKMKMLLPEGSAQHVLEPRLLK